MRKTLFLSFLVLMLIPFVQASHQSYSGTNHKVCVDKCVLEHEEKLDHFYACENTCSGIVAENSGDDYDYEVDRIYSYCINQQNAVGRYRYTDLGSTIRCEGDDPADQGCWGPFDNCLQASGLYNLQVPSSSSYPTQTVTSQQSSPTKSVDAIAAKLEQERIAKEKKEEQERIYNIVQTFYKEISNFKLKASEVPCSSITDKFVLGTINKLRNSKELLSGGTLSKHNLAENEKDFYRIKVKDKQLRCFKYISTTQEDLKTWATHNWRIGEFRRLGLPGDTLEQEIPCPTGIKQSSSNIQFHKVEERQIKIVRNGQLTCYGFSADQKSSPIDKPAEPKFVRVELDKMGDKYFRSAVPIPDLTQNQIDFVNKELEAEEARVARPTLLKDLHDSFKTSRVLYEDEFSWAPGLNVQVSSNPQDITVWGAKVVTGPYADQLKGKITKKVFSQESLDKISTSMDIVAKHNAIYEIADSTPQDIKLSGDYSLGPITIGITYDPELIPEGSSEYDLGFFHGLVSAGSVSFNKVNNYYIDTANKIIYGKVDSFSFFTIAVLKEEKLPITVQDTKIQEVALKVDVPPKKSYEAKQIVFGILIIFLVSLAVLFGVIKYLKRSSKADYGKWSIIFGVIGILLFLAPYAGLLFSYFAVRFSKEQKDRLSGSGKIIGIIGIVLNVFSLIMILSTVL
ncbi:TMEM14 family protein [Candidatus Woesearchaeota archaeon]|nr:TMEM14 family protein [Candidatus Woesearchaeota archaeon]